MFKWFRRLIGLDCCGPWSKWETIRKNFVRPTSIKDDGDITLRQDKIEFTRVWQERHCTKCNKVQQRPLALWK